MYNSQIIAERIRTTIKQQGKSLGEVLSECELGKNTVSKIEKGTDILTLNFAKIADNLNCSLDYLLGRTDNPNVLPLNLNSGNHIALGDCCQNNPVVIGKAAAGSEPDELEQEVIRILKELPIRKRTELLTVMYQYLDENKKKEDESLVDES